MPFHIIRGTFHVKGYSPDGDSIRFKAINEANWDLLDGPPPQRNARGHAQLRLEGIDTLETHYQNTHQPLALAKQGLDHLLTQLGITGVQCNPPGTMVTEANDGVEGYILSRQVEKNRRPVAFAFAGTAPAADGTAVFLDTARALQSANAEMLRSGLAYPTYYKGLFPDLRNVLTAVVETARQANRGIWRQERTNTGFVVHGLASIALEHVILPKLFRRLAAYLEGDGCVAGFKEYLADLKEEIFIIPTAHATHFDTVVAVHGNTVRLTEPSENLIFEG
jgi:endonuclease YncB( thermonuclease family)